MKKIYFAGPLFNKMELAYNQQMKVELEKLGFSIVLPQDEEFPIVADKMGDKAYADKMVSVVARGDFALIDSCDAVIINLDGITTDSGACVEIGYAYAKGKPCFALKTDTRCEEFGLKANMMVLEAVGLRVASNPLELAGMMDEFGLRN